MSSREFIIASYLLFALVGVVLELLGRRRNSIMPTFSDVLSAAAGTTYGRLALVLLWWWLGWHFLARSSAPAVDM